MTAHLTLSQLESYLWGTAVILRGLVDAGDYKQFIFPLVFYKRLSDVWDDWEQDGRAFWQQMDALVDTLDGLIADQPDSNAKHP